LDVWNQPVKSPAPIPTVQKFAFMVMALPGVTPEIFNIFENTNGGILLGNVKNE